MDILTLQTRIHERLIRGAEALKDFAEAEAIGKCPVSQKTKLHLYETIKGVVEGEGNETVVTISAGGGEIDYAAHVEYGTRDTPKHAATPAYGYMRHAVEQVRIHGASIIRNA